MNATTAWVDAQAKVNLTLRVLAREVSGFHQIETLFCRIDLADRVRVRLNVSGRSLECSGPAVPAQGLGPTEKNLAWRAATAFTNASAWGTGFAIEVEKHIPVGGGLGGGSADAGAVLRCLNALSPRPLARDRLLELASTLGADVPFLTQDLSTLAFAWGRGDRLLTLPSLPARPCLVVSAPFGVNTADAYGWLSATGVPRHASAATPLSDLASWRSVDALTQNDFERPVFAHLPALHTAFAELDEHRGPGGLAVVRMSGSGSTLFGLFDGNSHHIPLPDGFRSVETRTSQGVASVQTGD